MKNPSLRKTPMTISAIVLAGGESKRMGRAKQLLPWQGKAILQQVLDHLRQSRVDETILVLGYSADQILREISTEEVKVVTNPDYAEGMSSSLRQGLRAMDKQADAFFVVLGDQPAIGPEVFDRLIHEFERIGPQKNILFPAFHGSRGHPVLLGSKYIKEARQLQGDVGCRQILADHPDDILAVELETAAVLLDIDTPQDYRESLKEKSPEKDP
jgi:molybdenum cofactor cytidylyltransferase